MSSKPTRSDPTVFASGAHYRLLDSGLKAPKGIVLATDTFSVGVKPPGAQKDDVICRSSINGNGFISRAALAAVFSGFYGAGAIEATLALTLEIERSPSARLPTDPFYQRLDLAIFEHGLNEMWGEPAWRVPYFGSIEVR